jgi:hypothetical protein
MTAKGPVGLWFMTRYINGSLEKAAWYFSPDGVAYENPDEGLSPQSLAAHKGRKGKFTWTGKKMTVAWSDGTKTDSEVESDNTGFMWDMGGFVPVEPFADAKLAAGNYEGGESLSHGGNAVMVGRTIDLKADGTYEYEAAASVKGSTDQTTLKGGATGGGTTGTWSLNGFIMTLKGSDGKTLNRIAFPFDGGDKIKRMYLGGTMYKEMK